jgi:predicted AAA+ superfamily ATPase
MKPWREVAVPHPDVLEGTFQQSEFAADITAVRNGEASKEYQEAGPFFERTYITEGMRLLLTQVAQRLNGSGGEPVVQLQTAFGGGKTHTMLAVFHLATRKGSLNDLAGIPALLDFAGVMEVPRAKVAILDGTAHAPGQPWKHGKVQVHTLWGELAWQLGGPEGYELVKAADTSGTSPGKDVLRELISRHAPCVVLVDELVAYVRQFPDSQVLSGGTYDSNLSFVQALTEAVKLVPNAMLLGSLPESEVEAGSSRGVVALRALEKTFGRVQALWKPVATEESFEIVRRRLFEPIGDLATRDAVCRAFASLYTDEGAKLPSETHEARYFDRLAKAYPIHPDVFDRLYEDWSSLESFQRTRGVLKLMAHVIHELWAKGNRDLLVLPSSLPLYRGKSRDELLSHLSPGWDPVLDRDVDDDRAESADLDNRETRFGAVHAARRVARTTFFASAPSSNGAKNVTRGVDRARILLGCLQPGQTSSLYSDALNRLADRLHYLNASGDKAADNTRFWFDTRANLRREMEDRKGRFDDRNEVRGRIAEILGKLTVARGLFDGVHVFTPHADVPDDGQLRLVVLDPERTYSKQVTAPATDVVKEIVRTNGSKPRFKSNRLVFLAPDGGAVGRLRDAVRTALAWGSIVSDIAGGRLNIDRLQETQAKKESETADAVAVRAARDCYKWVLCPVMQAATDREPQVEAFALNTGATSVTAEIDRVCEENELIISAWSPIHLRTRLRELYWKDGRTVAKAMTVWEDMQKYLYLPRLKNRAVFEQAITTGATGRDFFGIAYGQAGEKLEGFRLGSGGAQLDDTLLLVEPAAAAAYALAEEAKAAAEAVQRAAATGSQTGGDAQPQPQPQPGTGSGPAAVPTPTTPTSQPTNVAAARAKAFFGSIDVNASTAKMKLVSVAEEIIAVLAADPNASVKVTLEISADFPNGASDQTKRAVSENATALGFKSKNWE